MSQIGTTAWASEITLREPGEDDVQECARICYEAFGQIEGLNRVGVILSGGNVNLDKLPW